MVEDGAVDRLFAEALETAKVVDYRHELEGHRAEIARARKTMTSLTAAIGGDDDPNVVEVYTARMAELKATIAAHQEEANRIGEKVAAFEHREEAVRQVAEILASAKEDLKDAPLEEKRLLLEALDLKIFAKIREILCEVGFQLVSPECLGG
jgi:chromosome segregation ATPase